MSRITRRWPFVFAVIVCSAAACKAGQTGPQPQPPPTMADAQARPNTKGVKPSDFTFQSGRYGWENADPYIHEMMGDVKKPAFTTDSFPNASIDIVRLCERCRLMEIAFSPERRSHGLASADFQDSMRVIGQMVLLHFLPPTGKEDVDTTFAQRLLGLTAEKDTSYLVTIPGDQAAFMYESKGSITFTAPWTFEDSGDSMTVASSQARWRRVPHPEEEEGHGLATGAGQERPHMPEPWVACADGCCVASPVFSPNMRSASGRGDRSGGARHHFAGIRELTRTAVLRAERRNR